MQTAYGARSYVQTQTTAATPLELVVMLYDAGVRTADNAHAAMVAGDIHARRTAMNKLMAIIAELQNTLDVTRGGKLAEDLDNLYTYMTSRLVAAVSDQDPRPIDEVRRLLTTLQEGWRQIAKAQPAAAGGRP
jgi:flagellar protein FliS